MKKKHDSSLPELIANFSCINVIAITSLVFLIYSVAHLLRLFYIGGFNPQFYFSIQDGLNHCIPSFVFFTPWLGIMILSPFLVQFIFYYLKKKRNRVVLLLSVSYLCIFDFFRECLVDTQVLSVFAIAPLALLISSVCYLFIYHIKNLALRKVSYLCIIVLSVFMHGVFSAEEVIKVLESKPTHRISYNSIKNKELSVYIITNSFIFAKEIKKDAPLIIPIESITSIQELPSASATLIEHIRIARRKTSPPFVEVNKILFKSLFKIVPIL